MDKNTKRDEIPWSVRDRYESEQNRGNSKLDLKNDASITISISSRFIRKLKEFFKRKKSETN